ncbi:MAG: hypothetical protein K8E24_000225 [Methanobacterium paludis]|nr:hypothetical protein [Methanobacterium paludis]
MVDNDKTEYENLKTSYKSTNAIVMFLGILLGGYILSPGLQSLTIAISVVAALFGAYNYKKLDGNGKFGYILLALAVIWAIVTAITYIHSINML